MSAVAPVRHVLGSASVSDALDALGIGGGLLASAPRPLCPEWRVVGPAFTLQAERDAEGASRGSQGLIDAADAIPSGSVVLIQADGIDCAMWGELTSTGAAARGAAGVVCNGLIRDVATLIQGSLPVFARGTTPQRSAGRADIKLFGQPITIGRIVARSGDLIVADVDGVLVIPRESAEEVLARAAMIEGREAELKAALESGALLRELFGAPASPGLRQG